MSGNYEIPKAPLATAIAGIIGKMPPFPMDDVWASGQLLDEVAILLADWCSLEVGKTDRLYWATGTSVVEAAELMLRAALEDVNLKPEIDPFEIVDLPPMSKIEWTDETWNPVVGCSKVSEGCQNCYAIGQAYRNAAIAETQENPGRLAYYQGLTEKTHAGRTEWTGVVNTVPEALEIPLKWKKPRKVFVNSMSDLFHSAVPFEFIDQVFAMMALTPQHTYQILTKRPDRMLAYMQSRVEKVLPFRAELARAVGHPLTPMQDERRIRLFRSADLSIVLPNIWLGVTVENQEQADRRIPLLLQTPAAVRFLSCEPLIDWVELRAIHAHGITNLDCLTGQHGVNYPLQGQGNKINWVIAGGESGPNARKCHTDWINSIVVQCRDAKVPVFVKQLGAKPTWADPEGPWPISDRKGAIVAEWPQYLQVQQTPTPGESEFIPPIKSA
jgi:protein gp37